jgi:MFS family permease
MSAVLSPATTTIPQQAGRATARIVGVLSVCGIVVALQQTMVVPLLPDFPAILHADRSGVGWLATATLLTAAVSTPVASRLADMFGKRRMILLCLVAMVAGSAIAALGTGLPMVVAGRAVQGLSIASIPIGISVMRDELPRERVASAVALMSATLGIGSAIGLPLSGLIYEHAGWRAVFWTVAAAGLVLAALVLAVVPESAVRTRGRFDVAGALVLSAALVCLLLAINRGGAWGWSSEPTLTLLASAAALLAAFVPLELRVSRPLVDLRTSLSRPVLLTNLAAFFIGYALYTNMLATTMQLQMPIASGYGFGLGVLAAGVCMLPSGVAMVALAPVSAAVTRRRGARATLFGGAAFLAAGYLFRAWFTAEVWQLVLGAVVASMGTAFALSAMPTLIMRSVPLTETASANGLNTLLRSIGTSVCSATVIALLAMHPEHVAGAEYPPLQAFRDIFWLATAAAAVAGTIAMRLPAGGPALERSAGQAEIVVGGTVLGERRQPVRQAVVTALGMDGRCADWCRADNDGRYSVVLPEPGCYVFVVAADGWAPRSEVVDVDATTSEHEIRLVEPLTLSGRVADDGLPVVGALVSLTRPTGETVAATRTDVTGSYSVPLPATGRYVLTVVMPERRMARSRQVLILTTESHSIDVPDAAADWPGTAQRAR